MVKSLISVSECIEENGSFDENTGGCDRAHEYCDMDDYHCVPYSGKFGFNRFAYIKCSHFTFKHSYFTILILHIL